MVGEIFCESQSYGKYKTYDKDGAPSTDRMVLCPQDDPRALLVCCAHLAEARAWPCPYNPREIYDRDGRKGISHRDGKGGLVGACEDFEPPRQPVQTATSSRC